jgi:large subunit ribosomal protein L25
MEKFQLQASVRDLATATPNALRAQGLLPAELYGHGIPNAHVTVKLNEFEKLLKKAGETSIVELVIDGGKVHNVLIHDVQRHYLKNGPIHVDFFEVSMTEKLTATVPLEFIGEAMAVKSLGGTLLKALTEVEVECLPMNIPHNFVIDISSLATFDDSIFVKDIKHDADVAILTDGEEVIAKVQPPRDVEAELAAPIVEDISKVEGAAENAPAAELDDDKK